MAIKKRFFLLTLVVLLFCNISFISASFNVSAGDIYEYEVLDSKLDSKFDEEYFNVTGVRIGAVHFDIGKHFKVNVTQTSVSSIRYNILCDGFSEEYIFVTAEILQYFNYYVSFPLYAAYDLINDNGIFDVLSVGLFVYILPFIDTSTESYNDISNILNNYVSTITTNPNFVDYEALSNVKERNNQFIVEWYFEYLFDYNENYSYTMKNSYKLAYTISDGVLLGSKIYGYAEGVLDGVDFQLILSQHIEQIDFDLEEFKLGDFATGNGKLSYLYGTFILLPIIILKRKKKTRD